MNLLGGNSWPLSFGFEGVIALTSTLYAPPDWPGVAGYVVYVTPELRIYGSFGHADVVEGLRDYIADLGWCAPTMLWSRSRQPFHCSPAAKPDEYQVNKMRPGSH